MQLPYPMTGTVRQFDDTVPTGPVPLEGDPLPWRRHPAECCTEIGSEQPGRRAPLPGSSTMLLRVCVGAGAVLVGVLLAWHIVARVAS